jgi:Zn-dependent M28 family amino/carboxypeptidase
MERLKVTTPNVIAIIEGNDPLLKNEFIVIGAHFDHLGFGGWGSGSRMPDTTAIHNGADDNASGTAGIIELAERLAASAKDFKRSIVVMAFGAEEMGLLGSQFFVSNPLIDLKKVKAMINFDMIGRLDPDKNSIMLAGTGTATEMEDFLANFEENSNLSFGHSPEGYGASDHASFYASGVPVMFFSTGAHEDYHTPFDDADKINYEGEKQILDYAYGIIVDLVNRDDNLTFQEAGPRKKTTGYGRGLKVKLGIMPDFTSSENNGLGVGGVTNGGPASKAGMQKGDRIIAIDGLEIANIYDYMNRLKKLKPGQTISVDVIRNNEKKVLVVVL